MYLSVTPPGKLSMSWFRWLNSTLTGRSMFSSSVDELMGRLFLLLNTELMCLRLLQLKPSYCLLSAFAAIAECVIQVKYGSIAVAGSGFR